MLLISVAEWRSVFQISSPWPTWWIHFPPPKNPMSHYREGILARAFVCFVSTLVHQFYQWKWRPRKRRKERKGIVKRMDLPPHQANQPRINYETFCFIRVNSCPFAVLESLNACKNIGSATNRVRDFDSQANRRLKSCTVWHFQGTLWGAQLFHLLTQKVSRTGTLIFTNRH